MDPKPSREELERRIRELEQRCADQERIETDLRNMEIRYRHLVQHAPAGVYEIDFVRGELVDVNDAMCEYTGYTREELLCMSAMDLLTDQSRHAFLDRLERMLAGKPVSERVEYEGVKKDGDTFWAVLHPRYLFEDGEMRGAMVVVHDVTERRRMEEALVASEERYAAILDGVPDLIYEYDREGTVVYANRLALELLGYSPKDLGKVNIADVLAPGDVEAAMERTRRAFEGGDEALNVVYRLRTVEGRTIPVEAHGILMERAGGPPTVLGIARDISERTRAQQEKERLEAQLRQAQRLEAIGTLAGGVAHDFNNILTIMSGFAELAREDAEEGSRAHQNLGQVLQAGARAKAVVEQMLAFSRHSESQRSPVRFGALLEEVLTFIRASIPTTIRIETNIDDASLARVRADATQIHQVLMNLLTNAAQAMGEGGGTLTIRLSEQEMDGESPLLLRGMRPGLYVRLEVSDTGPGMDRRVLERCFDPFFTTKKPGEGTGMGLAVVHGIIKGHGGQIHASSSPGKGTTFEVLLPVVPDSVPDETEPALPVSTPGARILFVDDEEGVADYGRQVLEQLGYRVAALGGSREALEAFAAAPDAFDLVITDLTMPGMTGLELAGKLRSLRPDVRIILCSGRLDAIAQDKAREAGICVQLMKPYGMRDLAEAIEGALPAAT